MATLEEALDTLPDKATFETAVLAILEEWAYQDRLRSADKITQPMEDHDVTRFILMLEHYVQKARTSWNDFRGNKATLNEIRKVTALGLRCMVLLGVERRTDTSRLTG